MTPYLELLSDQGRLGSIYHDEDDRTLVSHDCEGGNAKTVKLLLAKGADASIENKYGIAPIHYACQANHPQVAELLLEPGANPTHLIPEPTRWNDGYDSLHPTQEINRWRFDNHPLYHVCKRGYEECFRYLSYHLKAKDL